MSKAVLISIKPKWCEKIANGEKTIEIRKSCPKLDTPFVCYIYCTKGGDANRLCGEHGKVIGEFICDRIFKIRVFDNKSIQNWGFEGMDNSCLPYEDIANYIGGGKTGYGWHISNLHIYDEPRKLEEFRRPCPNDLYCESCAVHSNYNGTCGNESLRRIKLTPQSWCYVEEME